MNMGGVNRSGGGAIVKPQAVGGVGEQKEATPDRDPTKQHYDGPEQAPQLSPEQEDEALKLLNEMESFKSKGLKGVLVREEGKPPHIVVKDYTGKVIRNMPYEQIVQLYLNRGTDSHTGVLIKKSA